MSTACCKESDQTQEAIADLHENSCSGAPTGAGEKDHRRLGRDVYGARTRFQQKEAVILHAALLNLVSCLQVQLEGTDA